MIIAQRSLKLEVGGREIDVPVRIYLPVGRADHWQCEYEIGWPAALRRSAAHGTDSIQALWLALRRVGAELYTSEAHRSGKLKLERPGGGYGFPLAKSIRDLYEGDDLGM